MNIRTFRSLIAAPAALHRGAPRRGQALLLAVLVMIFAALIGSTFITVISLNMDRTSAQEQRVAAANAARNGLEAVNYQLVANGSDWRPEQIAPPPAPGDLTYNFYYTPQEISQGFARFALHPTTDLDGDGQIYTTANPDFEDDWLAIENGKNAPQPQSTFVKFPDPRLEQVSDVPTYLAEVRVAGLSAPSNKQGMLQVTVVGASPNDPNVLVPRTQYKGTSQRNGAFSWSQFHSDWDYNKKGIVSAKLASTTAVGDTSINVDNAGAIAPGRTLTLQQGLVAENAVVKRVAGNTIDLKSPLLTAFPKDAAVRASTILMNDLIGNESLNTLTTQFNADGRDTTDTGAACGNEVACNDYEKTFTQYRPSPFGIMLNTDGLIAAKSTFDLPVGQPFKVAGLILPTTNNQTRAKVEAGGTELDLPTSLGATQVQSGTLTGVQKQVYDNQNADAPIEEPLPPNRNVRPIVPPDLASFTRLQDMTRYTPGGADGTGPGIYIDNQEDVEKVLDGTGLRELSISDMQRLWQGKSFPATGGSGNADMVPPLPATPVAADYAVPGGTTRHRLSFPRRIVRGDATAKDTYTYPVDPAIVSGISLEQRGIRGWINTNEFVPRGALVELDSANSRIIITLDDRSDAGGSTPDPKKAWPKAVSGSDNCYRMVIDIANNQRRYGAPGNEVVVPGARFNGVIYAEGNIRIRGTNLVGDLTVVSMNNIYIEGNLRENAGGGHIALLARKNVVLNPTQFVTHVAGSQDADTAIGVVATAGTGAVGSELQLTPDGDPNTGAFRVGDLIRVVDQTWRTVIKVDAVNDKLTLDLPLSTTLPLPAPAPPTVIRPLRDPSFVPGENIATVPAYASLWPAIDTTNKDDFQVKEWMYRLKNVDDVLARDVRTDGVAGAGPHFLGTRASGERKQALTLKLINSATGGPYTVSLSENANANTALEASELQFQSSAGAYGFSKVYDLRQVDPAIQMNLDSQQTIDKLRTEFKANELDTSPPPPDEQKWDLNLAPTTTPAGFNLTSAEALLIAARRLLPIGLDSGTTDDASMAADAERKLFLTTSAGLSWGTTLGVAPLNVFGSAFPAPVPSPLPVSPAPYPDPANADLETNREGFYFYNDGSNDKQQWLRWLTRPVSAPALGSNIVSLSLDPDGGPVAPLRVAAFKLQKDDFSGTTFTPVDVQVQATIFAQGGSWFVIPTPRLSDIDADHMPATPPATAQDNATDAATVTRDARLNYQITVKGAIVQNFAPTGLEDYDDEDSPSDNNRGAMASWIDALSCPTAVEADTYANRRGRDWKTIIYANPDPIPVNSGMRLPLSPDVDIVN